MSHNVDLRAKKITRNREGHYIREKGSIHQEEKAILNVYAPKNRTKTDRTKVAMDKSTITVVEFNSLFSSIKILHRNQQYKL